MHVVAHLPRSEGNRYLGTWTVCCCPACGHGRWGCARRGGAALEAWPIGWT